MGYISELRKFIGNRPIISVEATILGVNEKKEILFQNRSDTLEWGLPGGHVKPCNESFTHLSNKFFKKEKSILILTL
ncbi:MAG: hypothetical protein ACQEWW_26510 [Bacillota bacterium]